MDISALVILIIVIIAVGSVIYVILEDPILLFKSFLRGMKADGNWKMKILFLPIWGPIWLIDKKYHLELYIDDFEDASHPLKIDFSEYDKYILIDYDNISYIKKILRAFEEAFNPDSYPYNLNGTNLKVSNYKNDTLIKIEGEINFFSLNYLLFFIDNSAPNNIVFLVKGVLINKFAKEKSYFIFYDNLYSSKLVGKTYKNKKLYIPLFDNSEKKEEIIFNSNIDYFRNFDFEEFEQELDKIKFQNLIL